MGSCQSREAVDATDKLTMRHSAEAGRDVRKDYVFGKVIDKGSAGTVYQVRDRKTDEVFACKTVNKVGLTDSELDDLKNEIRVLRHLGPHPHIVGVVDVYEDRNSMHLIMQLCSGGELFQRLASRQRLSEPEAAKCLYAVMRVVQHCHAMSVVHRGIQPENFLLETSDCPLWCLRAIDFGASAIVRDDEKLTAVVGSPHYVAPEVLKGCYHIECDIWSAGVMLYILLSGRPPFDGENDEQVLLRILSAPMDLRSGVWAKISDSAKDLIKAMLSRNPRRRLTADEVLAHEWMCSHVEGARQAAAAPELLIRMQEYARMSRLTRNALRICASRLPSETVQGMRSMFTSIDRDGNDAVSLGELIRALRKRGARNLSVEQVDALMRQMGTSGAHMLEFDEFLAATMHSSIVDKSTVLLEVFKQLDPEDTGSVTRGCLEEALLQSGYLLPNECTIPVPPDMPEVPLHQNALTQTALGTLLAALDPQTDGRIDYEVFCSAFFAQTRRSFPTWAGPSSASASMQNLCRFGTKQLATPTDSTNGGIEVIRAAKPRRRSSLSQATYPEQDGAIDSLAGRAKSYHVLEVCGSGGSTPQRDRPGNLSNSSSYHDVVTLRPGMDRPSPQRKSPLGPGMVSGVSASFPMPDLKSTVRTSASLSPAKRRKDFKAGNEAVLDKGGAMDSQRSSPNSLWEHNAALSDRDS